MNVKNKTTWYFYYLLQQGALPWHFELYKKPPLKQRHRLELHFLVHIHRTKPWPLPTACAEATDRSEVSSVGISFNSRNFSWDNWNCERAYNCFRIPLRVPILKKLSGVISITHANTFRASVFPRSTSGMRTRTVSPTFGAGKFLSDWNFIRFAWRVRLPTDSFLFSLMLTFRKQRARIDVFNGATSKPHEVQRMAVDDAVEDPHNEITIPTNSWYS